jgi:hypothetical protein
LIRTIIAAGIIAAGLATAAPAYADTTDTDPSIPSLTGCTLCTTLTAPLDTGLQAVDGVQDQLGTSFGQVPVVGPIVTDLNNVGEQIGGTLTSTAGGLLGGLGLGITGTTTP